MRAAIFSSVILLFSCNSDSVPEGVFPKEKMGNVLYDIVLADEWVDYSRLYDSTYMHFPKRAAIYDSVFQVHGITKEAYQKSMAYYQGRPDILKDILESLRTKADTTSERKIKALPEKVL